MTPLALVQRELQVLEQAQVPAGGAVSGVLVARGHDMTSSTSVISPRIERRASIAV